MRTLGIAVLAGLVLVAAGCGGSGNRGATMVLRPGGVIVTAGALRPRLPTKAGAHSVLRFGCPKNPGTTVAVEACEVRKQLRLDRRFNSTVAALWPHLTSSARRWLARSQTSWLAYRRRQCVVESSAFAGGTEQPVASGSCFLRLTAERIADVDASLRLYSQGDG